MTRILILVLGVYAAVRMAIVLALGDVFVFGEELEKGFVAKAIVAGVDVPYSKLPYHPYEGGGFVASHLKALAFLIVGPNLLAHKLCALLWGLAIVWASTRLLFLQAGAAAAVFGGFLLTFGPAHFQQESLLHLGIHFEALLFIALVLGLGLRVAAYERGDTVPAGLLVALGLSSGFGTYFSYQVPLAVLAVIVMLAIRSPKRIFAPALVLSTLAGLLPLAWMAWCVGDQVIDIHGEDVGANGGIGDSVAAFWRGLGAATAAPLARGSILIGALASVAGYLYAPPTGARIRAALLFGGFALLWCIAAIASGMATLDGEIIHWFQFVRLAPLVFALLMLVAILAGPGLAAAGNDRATPAAKITRVAAALLLGIGAIHSARVIDAGKISSAAAHFRLLASVRGDEPRNALTKIAPRLVTGDSPRPAAAYLALAPFFGIEDRRPDFLVSEVVAGATNQTDAKAAPLQVEFERALVERGMGEHAEAVVLGLGSPLYHYEYAQSKATLLNDPDADPLRVRALGLYGAYWYVLESGVAPELESVRGTLHEALYLEGVGARAFRCGVMQPYWRPKDAQGPVFMLRPGRVRRRLVEVAGAAQATPESIAALLRGFDGAAEDFGFPDPTWPQ